MRLVPTISLLVLAFIAKGQMSCFNENIFELFRDQIIDKLQSKGENNERSEILIKHFKEINYSAYYSTVDTITENRINCSDIKSLSLVETYSWHSLLHRTYIIAEVFEDTFHVATIDHFKNTITYLGVIESDYLSQMAGYIIPRSDRSVGNDYILTAQLFKSGHVNSTIASNSDIFEMNQLFLVEYLLFKRE